MITVDRPNWDDTFLAMAAVVAQRATCPRLSVGVVLVDMFHSVISTGYNGAVVGQPHCLTDGCVMDGNHCVRALHAEQNAITQAARRGVSTDRSTIYLTHAPCVRCASLVAQAGVREVVYSGEYDNLGGDSLALLRACGINVWHHAR